jgi:hypothetical protein
MGFSFVRTEREQKDVDITTEIVYETNVSRQDDGILNMYVEAVSLGRAV